MKTKIFIFTISFALSLIAEAQEKPKAKCNEATQKILAVALQNSAFGPVTLIEVKYLNIYHVPAGNDIEVEQLTYTSDAATVVIQSIPDFYHVGQKGKCELMSLRISRD